MHNKLIWATLLVTCCYLGSNIVKMVFYASYHGLAFDCELSRVVLFLSWSLSYRYVMSGSHVRACI